MANFVFNRAKGRVVELYNNVDQNTPSTAVLVVIALATAGLETDAVLIDKDTMADVVSGTTDEVTNSGYARKVLADTDLATYAPDDTNDRTDLTFANQTWTTVAAGSGWSKLVVAYCADGNTTAGNNANIVPLTCHDFVLVPDGSDVVAQVGASGFYRAS